MKAQSWCDIALCRILVVVFFCCFFVVVYIYVCSFRLPNKICPEVPFHNRYYYCSFPAHTTHLTIYSFMLYLPDEPPEMQFSTRILIGIGILIAIAVPGIACVIFKYLKVRRWSKQQEEREEEFTSQSLQPLRRFPVNNSSESTNRYSSMPLAESSSTPSHTHTCIIGESILVKFSVC